MDEYIEIYRETDADGKLTKLVTTDIGTIIGISVVLSVIVLIIVICLVIKFLPVKEREIEIVKKRKSVRDLPRDPTHTDGTPRPPTYELHTITVDFRYVGKKHIHTYFIDESLYKKFREGGTYKVRMKYPNIIETVRK